MLVAITTEEQTMSRTLHQEQDGMISIRVRWQISDLETAEQTVFLHVENIANNATQEYQLKQKSPGFSHLQFNLQKGDFELTLLNISGRGIKAIDVIKNKSKNHRPESYFILNSIGKQNIIAKTSNAWTEIIKYGLILNDLFCCRCG